jgi:superfamily II DNA/RNA helicase
MRMTDSAADRDDLATEYLATLPFEPYPVQEDALLAWFTSDKGVLVCAPTGTGKTVIAEAAMFEALKTGKTAYYTTPLIALTEQKFQEMQAKASEWGFDPNNVGLVTGNRRQNPDAKILVVVAEILLNRLLNKEVFHFDDVAAVVMDEFHSFNDPERGIVWELTLGLLPEHVRTLLLSATVGNAMEFKMWLERAHQRRLELVESQDRKVPLTFEWIGDQFLSDVLVKIASGSEEERRTPALVFCFNRDECWNVAEQMKGKKLIDDQAKTVLNYELKKYDLTAGAGPKLKQVLMRGVGVHHAGVLPKYRRIVEHLFQQKLLSVCICTETLAAGINLPARSVVVPNLMKGPFDNKKLIEPSAAHQMFGRAGRPQFDDRGYVIALAHDDDVRIAKWRERFDKIPDNAKDAGLRKAKKALKKKKPKRRDHFTYWTEDHFEKLKAAPPGKLYSKGRLPWRLLAHVLELSPDVELLRELVSKRLMDTGNLASGQKQLHRMLMTLWRMGYVTLEPPPPVDGETDGDTIPDTAGDGPPQTPEAASLFGVPLNQPATTEPIANLASTAPDKPPAERPTYRPMFAHPTEAMEKLTYLRSVHPLFGVYLASHMGGADRDELLQIFEGVLDVPPSVARHVRVPKLADLPPGPLATTRLDSQLLSLGLATEAELTGQFDEEEDFDPYDEERRWWPLTLMEKLVLLFNHDYPGMDEIRSRPVWIAGDLLKYGGNFNKLIQIKKLQKQEGIIFRHLLRLILLLGEFEPLCPPDLDPAAWSAELREIRTAITASCQSVDPTSTKKVLEEMGA